MMRTTSAPLLLLAFLFGLASCEEKQEAAPKADAGPASDKPALDPSLAKAVQAASAASANPKSGKTLQRKPGEPPPTGVFGPGEADKEQQAGATARITLGSQGSEPRVAFTDRQPKPGAKQNGVIQLQLTTGPRQGLPPIEFGLSFQAQKAGGAPAAKPAEAAGAAGSDSVSVVATVAGVKLVERAGVPAEFSSELAKLKGTRVEYQVAPNGAGNDYRYTLSKAADPGLDNAVRSLTEAIAMSTLPFPDKPLGNGAYFMAVTRESSVGVEVLAYRLVKVTEVKGDTLMLSINTKRYATSSKFDMPGLPQDLGKLSLEEFQSTADGTIQVVKGVPFAVQYALTSELAAGVSSQKQPDQRLTLQAEARAEFTLAGGAAPAPAK